MDTALDPGLVERFRADLARVWPLQEDDARLPLGIAVSGGADSTALLLLAHAALPGRVEAATVDHRLRAGSAAEAAEVARLCAALSIPHATLEVGLASGNLQDRARAARYAALGEWFDERGLGALATAHQLDDQAETLLMRLNRGSGVGGLAGVRARTGIPGHGGRLIRPLLCWRRSELARIVERAGIAPANDPSNADERFDRVRMRKALAEADWLDPAAIARSAQLLGEAEDMLEFMIGREWSEQVEIAGEGARYRALRSGLGGVNLVRIGVVQSIYRRLGTTIGKAAAAQLVERLIAGKASNIGGIQARAADEAGECVWIFAPENPRRTG